jgi:hypothetical protein
VTAGTSRFGQAPPPDHEASAFALTRQAIVEWADEAKPGDRIVYARAPSMQLPKHAGGVQAAREMYDSGRVTLAQQRISASLTAYIAIRSNGSKPPSPKLRLAGAAPDPDTDQCAKLMAILRNCAASERPCPTNRELGRMLGGMNGDQAAYLLRKLQSGNRIQIDQIGPSARRVTIRSSGKRTGVSR